MHEQYPFLIDTAIPTSQREQPLTAAELIIVNAMECAVRHITRNFENAILYTNSDALLREETREACDRATRAVLDTLSDYPDVFRNLYDVCGNWILNSRFRDGFDLHHVAVAQAADNSQLWYAVSPANYGTPNVEHNRLTSIIIGNSFPALMQNLQMLEGGTWPASVGSGSVIKYLFNDASNI